MAIDEDALRGASGDAHVHGVNVDEVGDELAEPLSRARRAQEQLLEARRPAESLRDRKRRLTRQRISEGGSGRGGSS